jgi:hypothetical protein
MPVTLAILLASGQGWAALMLAITTLLIVAVPVVVVLGIATVVTGIWRRIRR